MIHTFSLVIQQPLTYNPLEYSMIQKMEVRGGLDNVVGKSGVNELN